MPTIATPQSLPSSATPRQKRYPLLIGLWCRWCWEMNLFASFSVIGTICSMALLSYLRGWGVIRITLPLECARNSLVRPVLPPAQFRHLSPDLLVHHTFMSVALVRPGAALPAVVIRLQMGFLVVAHEISDCFPKIHRLSLLSKFVRGGQDSIPARPASTLVLRAARPLGSFKEGLPYIPLSAVTDGHRGLVLIELLSESVFGSFATVPQALSQCD